MLASPLTFTLPNALTFLVCWKALSMTFSWSGMPSSSAGGGGIGMECKAHFRSSSRLHARCSAAMAG